MSDCMQRLGGAKAFTRGHLLHGKTKSRQADRSLSVLLPILSILATKPPAGLLGPFRGGLSSLDVRRQQLRDAHLLWDAIDADHAIDLFVQVIDAALLIAQRGSLEGRRIE